MSRLLMTAAVLAVLVYAMVLGVHWLSPRIEQDISDRVTKAFAEQGLLWADVAVQGRDVVLTGEAPDADAKTKAVDVASRVFGVSKVDDELTVAGAATDGAAQAKAIKAAAKETKTKDYTLTITKDGENVAFAGNVPDEASQKVLMELATNRYGEGHVDGSKLVVVAGAPAGWRSAAGAVLMHISNMEQASVTVNGNEVMISGTVLDKEFSDQMETAVSTVLPKNYKTAFAVDVVTPTVPDVEPAAGPDGKACDMVAATKQVLHFGFDKAEITAEHEPALKVVEGAMDDCADGKLVVAGYTDVTGSSLYNKWLSQQRAEATLRRLMRDGVAKDRLSAVGYGEQYPVGDNHTRDGRAANRRVEFSETTPHADGAAVTVKAPAKVEAKAVAKEVKAPVVVEKPVAKVEKPAMKAEPVAVKAADVEPAAGPAVEEAPQAAPVAASKPWWASKTVSETSVEVK